MKPRRRVIEASVLVAVTLLVSAAKLGNAFVWDDLALIERSDFIHQPSNLGRAFLADTMFAADKGAFQAFAGLDTYRPLSIATFFWDAQWSGRAPWSYHVTNTLLHLACVMLLWVLVQRLVPPDAKKYAVWAALAFAVHPLLGEAHVWINGRSDPLATAFGLAAMTLWMRVDPTQRPERGDGRRTALAGLLFATGLFGKETLLFVLPALAVWDLGVLQLPARQWSWRQAKGSAVRLLPLALAAALYLGVRAKVLRGVHASGGLEHLGASLVRLPLLLLDGFSAVWAPRTSMPRYLMEEYDRLPPFWFVTAALVLLGLAVVVWRIRLRAPLIAFALVGFVCTLAPVCLIATMRWYGFGRYLYLPTALLAIGVTDGVARAIAALSTRGPRAVWLLRVGAVMYVAVLAVLLVASEAQWDGSHAFYGALMAEQPYASHGFGGLGKVLVEERRPSDAIPLLKKAIAINAGDHRYWNNLAMAELDAGRIDDALRTATEGAARFPGEAKFYQLRAITEPPSTPPLERARTVLDGLLASPTHEGLRSLFAEMLTRHPQRAEFHAAFVSLLREPRYRSLAPMLGSRLGVEP